MFGSGEFRLSYRRQRGEEEGNVGDSGTDHDGLTGSKDASVYGDAVAPIRETGKCGSQIALKCIVRCALADRLFDRHRHHGRDPQRGG